MTLFVTLPSTPRIARFVAVVAIALATGHLAQTLAADEPVARQPARDRPIHIVQLSSDGGVQTVPVGLAPVDAVPDCKIDLKLKPLPDGMIDVAVQAPCRSGSRVVLRQAGLAVTGKVGPDGRLRVTLPALTSDGRVAVLFTDGVREEQAIAMPDVARLSRFVVQWQGVDAFALHAFENGADYDQPGDIRRTNPGGASLGAGFVTVLGDRTVENPLLAEVYTYPQHGALETEILL